MDRRAFLNSAVFGILVAPLTVEAEPSTKTPKIGLLVPGSPLSFAGRIAAFRQGLRELGHIEGQNVTIESRFAEGTYERFPDLAAQLVRLKVDIIVTMGTPAALTAKHATNTIPIVMTNVGDAVGVGLVASLARPGGNITGSSYLLPELVGKRLELLKEILPGVTEVAILVNPENPLYAPNLIKAVETAARSLGMRLHIVEVRYSNQLDSAFSTITRTGARALAVLDDGMFVTHRERIASLALKSRLPTTYGLKEQVEAGGLIAYGPSQADMARRAATFVDKILKGAKPADLPVERPTKFELLVNLKTAKALGLTIPPSLLLRADEIIQ